jgi:hypothetical protein
MSHGVGLPCKVCVVVMTQGMSGANMDFMGLVRKPLGFRGESECYGASLDVMGINVSIIV